MIQEKVDWAETLPASLGGVTEAGARLDKQLSELDSEVDRLAGRLRVVLRESEVPSAANSYPTSEPPSELARSIEDLNLRARRITNTLADLVDRIDL